MNEKPEEPEFNTARERNSYYDSLKSEQKRARMKSMINHADDIGDILQLNYKNDYSQVQSIGAALTMRGQRMVRIARRNR